MAEGIGQLVECLISVYEALGSIPITTKSEIHGTHF